MSQIVIEDEAWRRIMCDEQLRRARSRLSFHEIRLIISHVRAASADTRPKDEDAAQTAASLASGAVPAEERGDAQTPSSGADQ